MDYLRYFGLDEEPFRLTPDPAFFYPSRNHHQGLQSLLHSTENREGFCLVTGEPGTGKTTLLNVFVEHWKDRAAIAMVLTPRLEPEDFLRAVIEDLGISGTGEGKHGVLRAFRDFLMEQSRQERAVIILVDEAQNLPGETLEELRLLSNLETEKAKLLQIILIGQPEILQRLKQPDLRQLGQRIVTRIHLTSLDREELQDYLSFRLSRAGRGQVRIPSRVARFIHRLSAGVPRRINSLSSRVLMSAFLEETLEVSVRHVRYALRSLRDPDGTPAQGFSLRSMAVAACGLLLLVTGLTVGWIPGPAPEIRPVNPEYAPVSDPGFSEPAARTVKLSEPTAIVVAAAANVRKGPGLAGEKFFVVYRGDRVELLNGPVDIDGARWYLVERQPEGMGWIYGASIRTLGMVTPPGRDL